MPTLNIKQAAAHLKIHPETLRKMTEIPRARIGRAFVFIEDDLNAYIRSQYEPQALREPKKGNTCSNSQNAMIRRTGGSRERSTASEYDNLLELKTKKRQTNSGPNLKQVSGGNQG